MPPLKGLHKPTHVVSFTESDMFRRSRAIWITWEFQRRSLELAEAFNAKLCLVLYSRRNQVFKPFLLSLRTLKIIFVNRPRIVFVQNPSNILAAFVCLLRKFLRFKVIVDRHSNFIFSDSDARQYSRLSMFISNQLSNFSLKNADLTIVTNRHIKDLVEKVGGKAFILQDKLPCLKAGTTIPLKGKNNIVFPCTFSPDEPIDEVIKAADYLDDETYIYVTGNSQGYLAGSKIAIPRQIIFTGFLCEEEYQSLLYSCSLLLALTTRPHTLLCCAYEAVSLCKPFVLSDHPELKEYFYKGSVIVENRGENIAKGIHKVISNYDFFSNEIAELKRELEEKWDNRFHRLEVLLNRL